VAVVVNRDRKLRLLVMTTDGTNVRTLGPSIEIKGSGSQGALDWSRDGTWIVVAGRDAAVAGLFRIPIDGSAPVRLVSGDVTNPVCSPDGTMIVYGGAVVGGRVPILAVRPNGQPVELPNVLMRLGGGHRFAPDGTLVYLPRGQSPDFWSVDLVRKTTPRPLTHLSDQGTLRTFDVTPDGKHIVFDRSRQNSDIYLIELPERK
jgi:Tol biopolymer transport system component